MELKYHLHEIRWRFFYTFLSFLFLAFSVFLYREVLFLFFIYPLLKEGIILIYTDLTEPFFSWLRFVFILSLVLIQPTLFYHFMIYIKNGLFLHEYLKTKKAVFVIILLYYALLYLSFNYLFPLFLSFFLSFQTDSLEYSGRMFEILNILSQLILGLYLSSFLLLASFLFYKKYPQLYPRSAVVLFSFLLASLLTPPDILSQVLVALPTILLFEISFIASLWASRSILSPSGVVTLF